jgi:transcriptional regulator with PAS, ATPase and Fis domain
VSFAAIERRRFVEKNRWVQEFSGAVVVCDTDGIILEMNDKAGRAFQKRGGKQLLGSNLFDCHPEPSRSKLKGLMEQQRANIYTVEKKGKKYLVHQNPWYVNGQYQGFVEIVTELASDIPHIVRDAS